ncbi:MAG TPA: chitobiase/beta-hexosaminidase C-terminal domain-containing protein [Terriglobales bacterium]|nr:chitobiase/beta-hexosaminidase C-terminal domain-containing protein [Terriglobales bacterium]
MSKALVAVLCLLTLVPLVPAQTQTVSFYQTTPDFSQKLQKQADLNVTTTGSASQTITVDPSKTYQQIDGFGASFTDSSAWLVYTKLTEEQRNDAMQKLFDRTNGIALSFIRQPMGASDLALNFYSYDDMPAGQTDPTLANFSIEHDKAYIIPVLKQALTINPNTKMMASPWSPPAWMKSNNSLLGSPNGNSGYLKPEAYAPFAQYFVKYIKAYGAEGIPTHYISMQNEPLYAPDGYTGMLMSVQNQIDLLGNHIGPAFADAGIKTKVMVYDHNWDRSDYAIAVLKDPKARQYAAGSAWHHYAGDPSVMSTVHDMFPDMDIWETEASGGTWQNQSTAFGDGAKELINVMRNWAKAYVLWNMVLDQNHGPIAKTPEGKHGCDTCRGVLTVNWEDGKPSSFKPELDYYVLGHASKFIMPGAYRIYSDANVPAGLYDVAFRNPDGSIVLYLFNNAASDQTFNVKQGSSYITATVKAGSIATFVWPPATAPKVALTHEPNGLSLAAGQTGSVNLTVSPLTGTPSVTLGCQVLNASGAVSNKLTCEAAQSAISFTNSTPQTTTVTIKPVGASAANVRNSTRWSASGFALLAGAFGIVFVGGTKKHLATAGILTVILFAGVLTSCGGGGGGGSTNPPPVTPTAATPVFAPAEGTYTSAQNVTISSATTGAAIYYTLDGSTPTTSSTRYSAPVSISSTKTLKAIATAAGYNNSAVATATYTITGESATGNFTMVITAVTEAGGPAILTVPVLVQ